MIQFISLVSDWYPISSTGKKIKELIRASEVEERYWYGGGYQTQQLRMIISERYKDMECTVESEVALMGFTHRDTAKIFEENEILEKIEIELRKQGLRSCVVPDLFAFVGHHREKIIEALIGHGGRTSRILLLEKDKGEEEFISLTFDDEQFNPLCLESIDLSEELSDEHDVCHDIFILVKR